MEPEIHAKLRKLAIAAAARAGAPDAWVEILADEAILKLFEQDPQPDNADAWIQTVATNLARERHRKEPAEGWGQMPRTNPDPARGEKPYPPSLARRS